MNRQQDESEIKALFQEVRKHDERSVPTFHAVADGLSQAGEGVRWWNLKTVVALLLVLAVISPVAWNLMQPAGTPPNDDQSLLSEWQAPTDFLLNFAGDDFGSSVPNIDSDPAGWTIDDSTAGQEEDS